MILITSASYVNPELQVEFGKLPPSFLPLGAKRLYEHQVELFENRNETIVLSLPEAFSLSIADSKKLKKLNIEIIYVKEGLSLGESIIYVLNMLLPINESLSILHGDTLFTNKDILNHKDSVEISHVTTSYDWEYVVKDEKVFIQTEENIELLKEYVVSGYFNFSNVYTLIKSLINVDYDFIEAIKLYSQLHKVSLIKNNTWMDFGLASTYFHSRKSFTTERAFNSLKIKNGYVEKCSEKVAKLKSEIEWYKELPHSLYLNVPRFEYKELDICYKTEYLYLNTLSELYVFGKLPAYVWKQIFSSSKVFLDDLHTHVAEKNNINFDYKSKTTQRIKEFSISNNIDLNKSWKYNNIDIPSLNEMIMELDDYLPLEENLCFIHGDFCMSNIMYDFRADNIKVFDPRGMDFDNVITAYGKNTYDHAKLMHSVIGLYDFIISGFYNLEYSNYKLDFEIDISPEIFKIQSMFIEVFGEKKIKKFFGVMIHLFLSMLPLHNDSEKKQYALLANAFRLYLELKKEQ